MFPLKHVFLDAPILIKNHLLYKLRNQWTQSLYLDRCTTICEYYLKYNLRDFFHIFILSIIGSKVNLTNFFNQVLSRN